MPDDPRVQQLLEELLNSNATPESVCQSCPELLPEVRSRWRQMSRIRAELDALFPTPSWPDAELPTIPNDPILLPPIPGYEVEALLGRGGMGVVFRARHLRLNRVVALKMALAGEYASPQERVRFQREAEAVARLRHPNVVQIHDFGDSGGRPYFTMELVEGGSLARKLSGTPQPARQAAALLATLAEAVQAAHQCGIVHRDLKPANVLLTADGTPKISDFGLARRLDGEAGLTHTGTALGTPSYMAPEQAANASAAVGPSTDIYALGAILYELLTGHPPFRAETDTETLRQVISQEPVPPSRLNPKVPRDLETICLKCLEKEARQRYASASDLAADLHRFQAGESIAARRPRLVERWGRWVRRNPTVAALVGATALFTMALIAGAVWLAVLKAQRRQAVEGDLQQVAELQQKAQWSEARVALQRADTRLDGGGPSDLRQRIDQARRDLDFVMELDRIRLGRVTSGNLPFYKSTADRDYTKALSESGLAAVHDPPDQVAARIRASAVRVALVAALDDWAVCTTDRSRRDWLLEVARRADPDPGGWRDRIRDPTSWDEPVALAELTRTVPVSGLSVSLLLALGERLATAGGDARAFLKRVQTDHPADFWANLILGDAVLPVSPVDAAGYYRAALASRPDAAVGYTALGDALRSQNLRDEAGRYYRRAIEIDPRYARGHTNLGTFLKDDGRLDEAMACYRQALNVDPHYAWAHFDLANALTAADRLDEAIAHFQQFHAIDPTNPYTAHRVRAEPVRQGHGEEVREQWKKELEANPPDHDAWFGYAELCLFLGHEEEYRQARKDLLRRFGTTTDPFIAERIARAILLLPPDEEELRLASALVERAVSARKTTPQWIYPYFLFAQGLAEYRQRRFESAIAIMRADAGTVMGPAPRLVIAMAQYRNGQKEDARKTLAAEIIRHDWGLDHAMSRDHWIWHVLRREAEDLIVPNAAAFLAGTYEPWDNPERLALLGVCRFQNRTRAAARLYADALAADPKLADDPRSSPRFQAARAAAQVGSGRGSDIAGANEAEQARWRKQAREWLRADLTAWVRLFDGNPAAHRVVLRQALARWKWDPDLAGLRDPAEVGKLSAEEQKECAALWNEVGAVLDRTGEATRGGR